MGRAPCFSKSSKSSLNRGCWSPDEDMLLKKYVETHGVERWNTIALNAGLMRSGKSCRLRWMNYLRPNVKLGDISEDEEELIIRLHKLLGNRWSLIAGRVPGRTDNEIKNYWNIHLSKKLETRPKFPISRRNRRRPLDCTDHENQTSMNSTNGNLDSRSADVAAANTPQLCSLRDSIPEPVDSREQDYSGPDLSDFSLCNATLMSGLTEPSPLLTDEFINAKIASPVVDRVNVSYEICNMDGFNSDQGVSTSGFENLSVESPCSDLDLSSFHSWSNTLPWINGSVEMQDQWFPCTDF